MKKSLLWAFGSLGALAYMAYAKGWLGKLTQGRMSEAERGMRKAQGRARGRPLKKSPHWTAEGMLDLNSASQVELENLHGMDAAMAERIVENRPYLSKIDLVGRMVIPDAAYESIKHNITVRSAA